jgi:hypothetical protein
MNNDSALQDYFPQNEEAEATDDDVDLTEDLVDSEDQENIYREASWKFLGQIIGCIQFLRDARSDKELMMRIDIVSLVFNHPAVRECSLAEIGRKHNKTRAAISAQVLNYQRANGLPPSLAQKSAGSRCSYSKSRVSKLTP